MLAALKLRRDPNKFRKPCTCHLQFAGAPPSDLRRDSSSPPARFAHTTIRSQATESVTDDNALKIGHGCETADGAKIPVITQSVVFPTVSPEISTSDGSLVSRSPAVIEQGTFAGLASPFRTRSVFRSQQVKYDTLGNAIGFSGTGVPSTSTASVAFLSSSPRRSSSPTAAPNDCSSRSRSPTCASRVGRDRQRQAGQGQPVDSRQREPVRGAGQGTGRRWHRIAGYTHDQSQPRRPIRCLPRAAPASMSRSRPRPATSPRTCRSRGVAISVRIRQRRRDPTIKRTLPALAGFVALAGGALAHTQDGSLGDPAAATDYYQVSCSDDGSGVPASLVAQVQNRGPTRHRPCRSSSIGVSRPRPPRIRPAVTWR